MPSHSQDDSPTLSEEFVREFTKHQRGLYLYILAQIGNPLDAEEILQDTNVIVLNKHHQFEIGTRFFSWAAQIANYEIMKYRDRHRRDRHIYSDEFITQVAEEILEQSDELERRKSALGKCLEKLPADDRDLITRRYAPGATGQMLAKALDRPPNSVYQSIGRIRKVLLDCINRHLSREATT